MRVSCRKDDRGYMPLPFTRALRILVDGIERTKVITADEEGRFVLRFVTPYKRTAAGDELLTEELRGDVVVLTPTGWESWEAYRNRKAAAAAAAAAWAPRAW